MAYLSTTTAHDVSAIKILEVKGATRGWYQIYLDDIHLCSAFGPDNRLPIIITENGREKVS